MWLKEKTLRRCQDALCSVEGKPSITKGDSASNDRLSGKMGHGYLPPAVAEHSPRNKVGQDLLVSLSAPAVLQQC